MPDAEVAQIPGSYQTIANKRNDYLIDRVRQRTVNYSGLEHLGSSDVAVIATRRRRAIP